MVLPWRAIDLHVHCRDEEQSDKATIASVITLAHSQGVEIIGDMPNTERPVTNRERIYERLFLVPKNQKKYYRLYAGLTGSEEQVEEAVWCYNCIFQVVGFKMFAGRSVGDLSVIDTEDQRMIYRTLAEQKFLGVLAVHCEKEAFLKPELWDPSNPISHTWARPMEAEVKSVRDQIRLAIEEGYDGHLHICHVSCPESVALINEARVVGLRISCGATPHHLMWDENMMNGPDGLIYKMNPPLRSELAVLQLRKQLLAGMIDMIETDHAPHTALEKQPPECLSGYPSLELYREFVTEFLPSLGLSVEKIKALTRDNILKVFSDKF